MKDEKFDIVAFDVDSTLVTFEGLDWLATRKGKDLSKLTKLSMDGQLKLEDVFKKKMDAMSPNYSDFVALGLEYCESSVPHAIEVISLLKTAGKDVYIITGNFQPAVGMLAKKLGISKQNVFTNKIYFDKRGDYKGFDHNGPLSINGGKVEIVQKIKGAKRMVFVGDGNTDLETKNSVELFVGFGGVIEREKVKKESDVYIHNMTDLLKRVLSAREMKRLGI